jgi:hypothetical protein
MFCYDLIYIKLIYLIFFIQCTLDSDGDLEKFLSSPDFDHSDLLSSDLHHSDSSCDSGMCMFVCV